VGLTDQLFINKKIEKTYYERLEHHKKDVLIILVKIIFDISERAIKHDESKFDLIEKNIFEKNNMKYRLGTKEYENNKIHLGIALKHHYENNRHHPEHFKNGIEDMNLIDLLEMMADWISASNNYENGNINRSLNILKTKYSIGHQLEKILKNTITYIKE
jgi:flagellar basal body rod protein FlgC